MHMAAETNYPDGRNIDIDGLVNRFDEERVKRLRSDGTEQYQELKESALDLDRDPNADPNFQRAPISEEIDVLIVGGGFTGLMTAARLREKGVTGIRIVERGADFGGTWYWNRYPGLACDAESYVYLPMLEELGVLPTEKYAKGPEILAHCQKVANYYDLYPATLFQTGVTEARWQPERHRWIVRTSRDDEIAARFVVAGTGFYGSPKLPRIPGMESFEGHCFHTSRWDYAYTGGNPRGNMTGLQDKVVGIIGTGATAIQAVPPLAKSAKHLYVFQRTPSSVAPRDNKPTDGEWAKSLEPDWARKRRDNYTTFFSDLGRFSHEALLNDDWVEGLPTDDSAAGSEGGGDAYNTIRLMKEIHDRIDATVTNKQAAEGLKPYYHYFCKRPTFSDDYYPAFNRPNVTLVDTHGKGVETISAKGPVVDGVEYPLDCLIYSTGFDFMTDYSRESGITVTGRDGLSLDEVWKGGPRTWFGMMTHNFPNMIFMRLPQTAISFNFVHTADEKARHAAYIISECLQRGVSSAEPSREAEAWWVDEVVSKAGPGLAFQQVCTPAFYNFEGNKTVDLALNGFYGAPACSYIDQLEAWQEDGKMAGLELTS
jgi:cyclohexanone monooxygenase